MDKTHEQVKAELRQATRRIWQQRSSRFRARCAISKQRLAPITMDLDLAAKRKLSQSRKLEPLSVASSQLAASSTSQRHEADARAAISVHTRPVIQPPFVK